MSDPFKVVVEGPLSPLAPDFHVFLSSVGYSPDSVSQQLQLLAHLSRWMAGCGVVVQELTPRLPENFFETRRQTYRNFHTPRSLASFVNFLDQAHIDRATDPPRVVSPEDELLCGFEQYLLRERGLRTTTIVNYLNQCRPFLRWRVLHSGPDWASLRINVKGHEFLPTSGQAVCPLVASLNARIWP